MSVNEIIGNDYQLSMNNYLKKETTGKTLRLKEFLRDKKVIIGFTPASSEDACWFGGKNNWVKVGDIGDDMFIEDSEEKITDIAIKPDKLLPKDTLLFSFKLSIGKVAITQKPLYTNEAIAGLIVKDPVVRKYLYYVLPALVYTTNRATKGDTLNKYAIENLEIPFDKEKIALMVKKLDALEKSRQEHIKEKEAIDKKKQSIISLIRHAPQKREVR